MKIPYGMMNFRDIIEEGYLYIDKTPYIEILEKTGEKYPFFIRPRRFGKSLFLSMLSYYYDEIYADDFQALFGNLYIGKHPTPLANSRLVLSFDFSGLNTENRNVFKESFRKKVASQIIRFLHTHESCFPDIAINDLVVKLEEETDPHSIVDRLLAQIIRTGKKLFILVDEYDHFANDILAMGGSSYYEELIRGRGLVRDFYETLKTGAKTLIDRIFITGISPVMLDDLTSGYNISSNFTTDPRFNGMMGFTEQEVTAIIKKTGSEKAISIDQLRFYYNGYLFSSKAEIRIYNPDMILYFIKEWIILGEQPENLIDDNIKTDYSRLKRLMLNSRNKVSLQKIIESGECILSLVSRFSFDQMYDPKYFESLLFYMGFLTFYKSFEGISTYVVPNYVIKTLFWDYFREKLEKEYKIVPNTREINLAVREMAFRGNLEPFISYIKKHILSVLSNRDLIRFNEKYIKVLLLSLLTVSPLYRLESEKENTRGYIDLFLGRDIRFPEVPYQWLWELKYLKESERNLLEKTKTTGLQQLAAYSKDTRFSGREDIKKALLIFVGKKDCYVYEGEGKEGKCTEG